MLALQKKRNALIQSIEELQRLSDLRIKKIKACHLLEKTAYSNTEAIGQYTQIRHLIEQYIPLKNTDPDFQQKTAAINKAFMGLCAGRNGESRACKAALRAGSEVSILQGLRLRYQGGDIEHEKLIQYATLEYAGSLQEKREVLSMMEHKIQRMTDEIRHGKKDIRFKIERWWLRKSSNC